MSITTERTKEIIKKFGQNEKNTGAVEVQVAILTERINNLSNHLQNDNKKDFQTRRGLLTMVHKRKKLMRYLMAKNPEKHEEVRVALGIRKS